MVDYLGLSNEAFILTAYVLLLHLPLLLEFHSLIETACESLFLAPYLLRKVCKHLQVVVQFSFNTGTKLHYS